MEHIDIDTFKGYLQDNQITVAKVYMEHDGKWFVQRDMFINPNKLCLDVEDFRLYYNTGEQSLRCYFWGGRVELIDKKFDYLKLMWDKKCLIEGVI